MPHELAEEGTCKDRLFEAIEKGQGKSPLAAKQKGGIELHCYRFGNALLSCNTWQR